MLRILDCLRGGGMQQTRQAPVKGEPKSSLKVYEIHMYVPGKPTLKSENEPTMDTMDRKASLRWHSRERHG